MGRLRLIVFVVGAASLGAEISAARLLAPYFGASTIIWANTIATVLVALSIGYAVGGALADRRRDLTGLCGVVLLAGVLLALVPFVADPFLRLSVSALGSLSIGGFLGSLGRGARARRGARAATRDRRALREPPRTRSGRRYGSGHRAPVRDLHRGQPARDVQFGAAADSPDRHAPNVPCVRARAGAGRDDRARLKAAPPGAACGGRRRC